MIEKTVKILPLLLVAGALLGALCGYLLPQAGLALAFLGQLFLGGLRVLMIPLLVAGTITGVASFGELRKVGGAASAMLIYFLATSVVAVLVAVLVAVVSAILFAPQSVLVGLTTNPVAAPWNSVSEALGGLIPGNVFQAVMQGKYLGIALLAVLLGGVLSSMGLRGRTVVTFFKGLHEGLLQVVRFVLYAAPVGIFSLVAAAVAGSVTSPAQGAGTTGAYLLASLVALAVYGFVVLPLAVWFIGGSSPWSFFGELSPALLTALGTSSKTPTFPVTYQCLVERSRLDSRSVSTVLPIGTALGLDGTAIMMMTGALFAAYAFGLTVGFGQLLLLAVLSIILSLAAAGLPSASLLAAPVLFGVVGLSAGQAAVAIAAMAAFEWLVDRVRAVVNVCSDATACVIVARSLQTRSAVRQPATRRPERFDTEPRQPVRERTGYRPEGFGDRRRRGGPMPGRERGRRSDSDTGRPVPSGPRPGPIRENADRSPFQMKAGHTPALGVGRDKPALPPDRPIQEIAERTEPRRPPDNLADSRRPRGRFRSGPERQEAARPRRAPEQTSEPPVGGNDLSRLKPDVVARDLSRVSAQLRSDEKEIKPEPQTVSRPEESVVDLPPGPEEDASIGHRYGFDDELPESDTELDDRQPSAVDSSGFEDSEEVESAPDIQEGEPDKAAENEPSDQAFGRSRHFKGAAFRNNDTPPGEESKEPTEESTPQTFTSGEASFGRVKRKRIRP